MGHVQGAKTVEQIIEIEKNYINDEVTQIVFEIDVIQTFMFDIDIKKDRLSFLSRSFIFVR